MPRTSGAAGHGGLLQALSKMRRFLLCAFVFGTFDMAMQDPLNAFLYSLQKCAPPVPMRGVGCPEGSLLNVDENECVPQPRKSASWSLSAHCMDRKQVVTSATQLKGAVQVAKEVVGIAMLLLVGPVVDLVGRRPVLMGALLCQVASSSLLLIAARLGASRGAAAVAALLTLAYALCGAATALFDPAASAMVADLSRGSPALRGDGYAALGMVSNLSLVVGFSTMYPILRMHLADYGPMWESFVVLGVVALLLNGVLLRETLPPPSKEEQERKAQTRQQSICQRALSELTVGFRVVAADPFLRILIPVASFATMAMLGTVQLMSPYQVTVLGYGNAQASICGMLLPVLGLVASALASPLIRRCGVRKVLLTSCVVAAMGLTIMGGGAVFDDRHETEAAFWVGLSLTAVAWNLIAPCFKTIVSTRVALDHQGNVFAFGSLITAILQVSFGLLWPEVLFDAEAVGLRRGVPFLATAGAVLLCSVCFGVACWTSRAEHAESSDSESSGEDTQQGASPKGAPPPTVAAADAVTGSGSVEDELAHSIILAERGEQYTGSPCTGGCIR